MANKIRNYWGELVHAWGQDGSVERLKCIYGECYEAVTTRPPTHAVKWLPTRDMPFGYVMLFFYEKGVNKFYFIGADGEVSVLYDSVSDAVAAAKRLFKML